MTYTASSPTKVERWYLVLTLTVFNALPFIVGNQPRGGVLYDAQEIVNKAVSSQGDTYAQIVLLGLYGACAIALLLRTQLRMLLFLGAPLLALIAWCFASVAWTWDSELALRRCTALLGTVILGSYVGLRFDFREMLRVMSYVTGIVLIASITLAVVSPSLGLDYEGRLRGVFTHKNSLGSFAALGLLMVTARILETKYRYRIAAIGDGLLLTICAVSLALSGSASPIPVLSFGFLLLFAARMLRTAHGTALALLPGLIAIALVSVRAVAYHLDSLATVLGRDPDLSGRTEIWTFAVNSFFEHPWLGYGYGTFWAGRYSPGAMFGLASNTVTMGAHNGYLELALGVGAIGSGLLLIAVVVSVLRLRWLLRHSQPSLASWAFAFLGFVLASNLTEAPLWAGNSIETVLFVYVIIQTNMAMRRAKVAGRAGSDLSPRAAIYFAPPNLHVPPTGQRTAFAPSPAKT